MGFLQANKSEKFYQLINGAAQAELENINTVRIMLICGS